MQAVPSLVGTGTVVAAAAAGLVFGQPPDSDPPRPSTSKRRFVPGYDGLRVRPGTSAAASSSASPQDDFSFGSFRQFGDIAPGSPTSHPSHATATQRPLSVQVAPSKGTGRRHSFIRPSDVTSKPVAESSQRDSGSSRDSWIRRLSIRPISQHGSPRSSMAPPDSPSLTFSNGSGVPILGQKTPVSHTAPNKLVKRTPSHHHGTPDAQTGRPPKSQMPLLRRPATSHQRSATLQQFQTQGFSTPPLPEEGYPIERPLRPIEPLMLPQVDVVAEAARNPGKWTSYFNTRVAKPFLSRGISGRTSESSPGNSNSPLPQRRVSVHISSASRPYLTKAAWITGSPTMVPEDVASPMIPALAPAPQIVPGSRKASQDASNSSDSAESTPSKKARKSMSMHFSSPTSWMSKTGSMRRARRSTVDAKSGNGRPAAAAAAAAVNATSSPTQTHSEAKPTLDEIFHPVEPAHTLASGQQLPHQTQQLRTTEPETSPPTTAYHPGRKRNTSSPLPPISRLSSFNIDVARLGQSSPSSTTPTRQHFHSPINYMAGSLTLAGLPRSRGGSGEHTSTLGSSDFEGRDGISGDDEDTDFKSDGMFDSFRTVASSSRLRTVETPIESMFDESPPSTAGNNTKTKRLSIQEILGQPWDGDTKIMEEDESAPTPIRPSRLGEPVEFTQREGNGERFSFESSSDLQLANRDASRMSLDEDDDDDWARDDENTLSNHLSPPSSSTNSRRVSPTFRHAFLRLNGNAAADLRRDAMEDRPRSNIFDWVEPSALDKLDNDGVSARPKTVHGKHELDLRVGRSVTRKGPSAAHIRSQSVPLAVDPSDNSKPAPKFGTWGLGTKTASEDWDDDFEFEEGVPDLSGGGKDSATSFSMVVPASIQATQPTVRAHSGQIRELSLLVNDLKRLCRHGKELDILMGSLAPKWLEAENIIALAAPDEDSDDEAQSARHSEELDRSKMDDRFLDEGFDSSILDLDSPFGTPERELREMSRTTVVKERQVVRRRSVFSPDDDIFGNNWPIPEESSSTRNTRPHTPESPRNPNKSSAMLATVIEAMQQQRSISDPVRSPAPNKPSNSKLFFDTNSLQELVKRAGHLRDQLADAVRRAELLTQSPARTPRRERHRPNNNLDGSPAFTRVFSDPATSPPRRLPKSHSTNSVLSKKTSVDSPRMQMMTVS
ncbi:hypothetical protein QBC37DRAFT_72462 [Rhypophila decipiens]|uniref:Uncharacterized protein n=1 Tax=Rhypophila decipiens TaxID=261697 RepID=A0AAN6YL76_9PEZI|nr:hypothetical protein QBC37DRAFT_72462 [Rhypophila decipiens]